MKKKDKTTRKTKKLRNAKVLKSQRTLTKAPGDFNQTNHFIVE